MTRFAFFSPTFLLFFVLHAPAVRADSLFPPGAKASPAASLFADSKARNVGDVLTILIDETASANSQAATKTSKTEGFSFGPGVGFLLSRINKLGLSGSINSSATGSTNRTDNLSARIAVTIKEVRPNGNLVIEGKRRVGMNAETQEITLTGVVRPQDVQADNTIASPLVADAQIKFSGKGPVGDKQRDGLITRIFKVLF